MPTLTLRQRIRRQPDPEASSRYGSSPVNAAIAALILVCATIAILVLVRLARLGRFSQALHLPSEAVSSRRDEPLADLAAAVALLVPASALFYLAERQTQPDGFCSIPRAMWWAIATLTTVGYGDVFLQTPLGKILAEIVAILGIGFIAIPTGILASAFSDALAHRRAEPRDDSPKTRSPQAAHR